MDRDLYDLSDAVHDEESFIVFLSALMKDRENEVQVEKANLSSAFDSDGPGWQNTTIESFLESAIAWAEDSKDRKAHYENPGKPWLRVAKVLHAGKTYE